MSMTPNSEYVRGIFGAKVYITWARGPLGESYGTLSNGTLKIGPVCLPEAIAYFVSLHYEVHGIPRYYSPEHAATTCALHLL